jgi:hypothetical protein
MSTIDSQRGPYLILEDADIDLAAAALSSGAIWKSTLVRNRFGNRSRPPAEISAASLKFQRLQSRQSRNVLGLQFLLTTSRVVPYFITELLEAAGENQIMIHRDFVRGGRTGRGNRRISFFATDRSRLSSLLRIE